VTPGGLLELETEGASAKPLATITVWTRPVRFNLAWTKPDHRTGTGRIPEGRGGTGRRLRCHGLTRKHGAAIQTNEDTAGHTFAICYAMTHCAAAAKRLGRTGMMAEINRLATRHEYVGTSKRTPTVGI
jgi:hypothetical protein